MPTPSAGASTPAKRWDFGPCKTKAGFSNRRPTAQTHQQAAHGEAGRCGKVRGWRCTHMAHGRRDMQRRAPGDVGRVDIPLALDERSRNGHLVSTGRIHQRRALEAIDGRGCEGGWIANEELAVYRGIDVYDKTVRSELASVRARRGEQRGAAGAARHWPGDARRERSSTPLRDGGRGSAAVAKRSPNQMEAESPPRGLERSRMPLTPNWPDSSGGGAPLSLHEL